MCANAAILYPNHGSRTSLLLQVLSPVSTSELPEFAPSTLLFVRGAIFLVQTLSAQCWVAKVESSSSTSRPHASMNKDSDVVHFVCLLLPPAICLQFQPLRGSHPNRMGSPDPCWHHTHTWQVLDTHFPKKLFLEGFILLDDRKYDPTILPSRLLFCSQLLDPRSQVDA